MQEFSFTVPGSPVPFNGWMRSRRGQYLSHKDRLYQEHARLFAMQALSRWEFSSKVHWDIEGEFYLEVTFYVPDLHARDRDNMLKNLSDAIKTKRKRIKHGLRSHYIVNKGLVKDDCMFVDGPVRVRLDRKNPRAEVLIRRVSGYLTEAGEAA